MWRLLLRVPRNDARVRLSMLTCHTQGPDALYVQHGDDLAAEIKAAGGIVTVKDLRVAAPLLKEPLTIQVGDASLFVKLPRW